MSIGSFIVGTLELLSLLTPWGSSKQTRTDVDRALGEPLERFRWVIYALIGAGVLMLVVALGALLWAS